MKTMKTNDPMKISFQEFLSWRKARDYRAICKTRAQMLAHCGMGQTNRNGKIYVHETDDFAPVVWDSKTDNRRNITGYYSDNFQDSGIYWCVVKIAPKNRKRNREALFAPVTYSDGFEGVTIHVDRSGSFDDAQQWGEQIVAREAEDAREEHAKDQAEQRISEARERIHEINRKVILCLKDLRTVSLSAGICAVLREKIMDYLQERDGLFNQINTLQSNPWKAVE